MSRESFPARFGGRTSGWLSRSLGEPLARAPPFNDSSDAHYRSELRGGSSGILRCAVTPKSDSHASQVRVAIEWGEQNATNQINLRHLRDSTVPGNIAGGAVHVTNLPDSPSCCKLATANFTPVASSGGIVLGRWPNACHWNRHDFYGLWMWFPKVPRPHQDNLGWVPRDATSKPRSGARHNSYRDAGES